MCLCYTFKIPKHLPKHHRLAGLVVKASAWRAADPGFDSRLRHGDFFRVALQWPLCQAPGVSGSALGLLGPVSVYCDWVRQFDLQLLTHYDSTYTCLSRSVQHVAGALSNYSTNKLPKHPNNKGYWFGVSARLALVTT